MILTPREEQVAQLVAEGFTKRQVAESLHISESWVDGCVRSIVNKIPGEARGTKKIMRWVLTGRPAQSR